MAERKEMTLEDHEEIITKWIGSCWTSEQLDLLGNVVEDFVVKRFTPAIEGLRNEKDRHVRIRELHMVQENLKAAIQSQRVIAASRQKKLNRLIGLVHASSILKRLTVPNHEDSHRHGQITR